VLAVVQPVHAHLSVSLGSKAVALVYVPPLQSEAEECSVASVLHVTASWMDVARICDPGDLVAMGLHKIEAVCDQSSLASNPNSLRRQILSVGLYWAWRQS
jgi:hypothetical protein